MVTLTKHRGPGPPDDEQLHVLPLYRLDDSPLEEQGQTLGELDQRKRSGALQVLTKSVFESKVKIYYRITDFTIDNLINK